MQKIRQILNQSWETAVKLKKTLVLVAAIYIVTLLTGYLLIYFQVPSAVDLSEAITESIPTNPVFTPIIGALMGGNLALAIAYTFLINLASGAFVSTTLPGMIPLLGVVGSLAVTAFRGVIIGAVYYYVFDVSWGYTIVALGTLILELGAYVFSATAGINISLATLFPERYQVESRWTAFKLAWKDAGRIYVIVIILLALGAIWEMTGIYLFLPEQL